MSSKMRLQTTATVAGKLIALILAVAAGFVLFLFTAVGPFHFRNNR